jgi:hypothetical protein
LGATLQADEPRPCGQLGNTVWYSLTPAAPATITIDTFGSDFDTVVAAYTGSDLNSLLEAGCNDDAEATLQSEISFVASGGTTYHIQAGGFRGDVGDLVINIAASAPPTPTPTKQPPPGDTDGDGCADQAENGPSAAAGGQRDFLNVWDFYDTPNPGAVPPRNRVIDIDDLFRVAGRFGTSGTPGDPLSPPPPTGYHSGYDRTFLGPDPWDLGPADGAIALDEIFWITAQFAHNCT